MPTLCVLLGQADANRKEKKKVEIYQMMMDLLKMEQHCIEMVRLSEREVQEILDDRLREEATSELSISIYDTQRNDKAKKHREMLVSFRYLLILFGREIVSCRFVRLKTP